MIYSKEVDNMCVVAKGPNHGPAPIPEEGKWIQAKEIKDISGYTHGVGWCAPQQGACKQYGRYGAGNIFDKFYGFLSFHFHRHGFCKLN